MSRKPRQRRSVLLALSGYLALLCAQNTFGQNVDVDYRAAVADYNAGRYAEAAHRLEGALPHAAGSYGVHELLGLTYASMSRNAKALEQFQTAVQLQPDSPVARTNLGAILLHSGKREQAAGQFRKALQLEPANYDANRDLGELYADAGQVAQAQPLLANAYRMKPDDYDNGYNLATADFLLGRLDESRQVLTRLVNEKNSGELHNLIAQIDEKQGKFVDAASEYEKAAHLDPAEDNLFDWGSEMLLHRTYEPAIAIFQTAVKRYPGSARLRIGLGLAFYSRGEYDKSVQALLKAAALGPRDPRCFYFLSKAYDSSPSQAGEVIQAFSRYAALEPQNALAQYYYALSLWKSRRSGGSAVDLSEVESLLKKSIALNDRLPEAHLQLGDLYADRHMYEKSVPEYQRALALNPNLSDAHFRLGTDYVHLGQRDKAQVEFATYQKLRAEHVAEVDKKRAEVKQFVYAAKAANSRAQ